MIEEEYYHRCQILADAVLEGLGAKIDPEVILGMAEHLVIHAWGRLVREEQLSLEDFNQWAEGLQANLARIIEERTQHD